MTVISNISPAKFSLYAVKGDTIDLILYVNSELLATGRKFYISANAPADGIAYNLGTLHIQVRRMDNLLLKDWLSGASPSDIVVTGNSFHIYDANGFLEYGLFAYDIEEFDGTGFKTIGRGWFKVEKEITL